jgi:hypothetical protein
MLSFHLCLVLPSSLLPLGFLTKIFVRDFHLSYMFAPLIFMHLIAIKFCEECTLQGSSLCNNLHPSVISCLLVNSILGSLIEKRYRSH